MLELGLAEWAQSESRLRLRITNAALDEKWTRPILDRINVTPARVNGLAPLIFRFLALGSGAYDDTTLLQQVQRLYTPTHGVVCTHFQLPFLTSVNTKTTFLF